MTDFSDLSLESLIGEQLSSVAFTMDYLQLMFNSQILNVLTSPSVSTKNGVSKWGEIGFRDEICSLITRQVESAKISRQDIVIGFGKMEEILIPLRGDDPGNEAVYFLGSNYYSFVLHQQ
jgi:hypothetical protein